MACQCTVMLNAELGKINTRLTFPIMLGEDQTPRAVIMTEQLEKGRGKPKAVAVFATYCPFCGEIYRKDSDARRAD